MRTPRWTASRVPREDNPTVYLVMDVVGDLGRLLNDTEADYSSLAAVDLLEGQHETPLRIISFNVLEGWGRDVSTDVALKAQQRCELQLRGVLFFRPAFVDLHRARYRDVQLPFPIRFVLRSFRRPSIGIQSGSPEARFRLSSLAKFLAGIMIGLLLPCELAAQGLPVKTGSHVPVWIWFVGSGVLGLAIAYGILRTRGRSRRERQVTEQATIKLYAEEERERTKSGEP